MSKKKNRITFRTTDENLEHLQDIQERYDLSISNAIHRMIKYFAKDGDAKKTFEKLTIGKSSVPTEGFSIWKHKPRR